MKKVLGGLPHLNHLAVVISLQDRSTIKLTAPEIVDALQPVSGNLRELKIELEDDFRAVYQIGSTALDMSHFVNLKTLELAPNYLDFENGFPPNLCTWACSFFWPGPKWRWQAQIIRSTPAPSRDSKKPDDTIFQPQPIRLPWKLWYNYCTWSEEKQDRQLFNHQKIQVLTQFKQREEAPPMRPYNGIPHRGPWIDPSSH